MSKEKKTNKDDKIIRKDYKSNPPELKRGQKCWLCKKEIKGTFCQEAKLQGANLQEAKLCKANLQGADLWGANLWGAKIKTTQAKNLLNAMGIIIENQNLTK